MSGTGTRPQSSGPIAGRTACPGRAATPCEAGRPRLTPRLSWSSPPSASPPTALCSAYLPFSHGPRNCIGSQFALLEARAILAVLIQVRL